MCKEYSFEVDIIMAKYSMDFYSRDAVLVAQDLLGKVIVVTDHGG